jgi:signal transduction histidine kinase
MPAAPLPINEPERLAAVQGYEILDTLPEQEYDDIVAIASRICGTPIALVSIVDENRQWFKARVGVDVDQTDRDAAFCAHAILNQHEVLSVPDATQDERFADNPLVTGDPHIRFYAGSPLVTPEGVPLGTLCVIDSKPRELTKTQCESLQALGRQVTSLLELRRRTNHLEFYRKELERSNRELQEFAYVASHDLKEPLRGISHLADFLIDDHGDQLDKDAQEKIRRMSRLTDRMQTLIDRLLHYARVGSVVKQHESVDLNQVISHVRESLARQIEEGNVEIESVNLPTVTGERFLIEELFQNLVSNAIKYNVSNAKLVRIGYATIKNPESARSMTSFYVADNGIGIAEKFRSDVFTIFRRLHGPDDYGGGTGAGLTIVRKIIETHGGKIWIDASRRSGTCFWFSFEPVDEQMQSLFKV